MKATNPPRKRGRPRKTNVVPLPVRAVPPLSPPAEEPPPKAAHHKKPGPPAWKPNKAERRLVEVCAAIGMTLPQTASVLEKSVKSIQRRCREEWQHGLVKLNAKIAGKLVEKCLAGDTASLIFFAKARLGWHEKQLHELTGRDGGPIVYDKLRADADAFTQRIAAMGARIGAQLEPSPAELENRTVN